jgi:hypothetical protein
VSKNGVFLSEKKVKSLMVGEEKPLTKFLEIQQPKKKNLPTFLYFIIEFLYLKIQYNGKPFLSKEKLVNFLSNYSPVSRVNWFTCTFRKNNKHVKLKGCVGKTHSFSLYCDFKWLD